MGQISIPDLPASAAATLQDKLVISLSGTNYRETLDQINTLFETSLETLSGMTGAISAPTSITGAASNMSLRTNVNLADTITFDAYDVDGGGYTTFGTLTANNTPSLLFDGASVTNIPNSGLTVVDTDASHALTIRPNSNLTAARALTLTTGDADRDITFGGDISTAGDFTMSGAYSFTGTLTGTTTVTFPTSGTLAVTTDNFIYEADATGTVAMTANTGYVCNAAGLTTLTLPSSCPVGKRLGVCGQGAGGWTIAQNASQLIHVTASTTTTGVGGSLSSTNANDAVELVCVVADTEFTVLNQQSAGLTIV